ncbi:ribonuclease kappa-A-like [Tubulanus polymorphus]|uniref:ribonuclease kappa-A-like n=1 Tax=Tubulanus polymorphus TaxID=672921 RepID=UPI003DA2D7FD
MPLCGPKCSICWLLLSVWGCIMLGFMGLFLRIHAATFIEDLPITEKDLVAKEFSMDFVYSKFNQAGNNCFVAAGVYVAVLVFSFIQYKMNMRANYVMQ